MRFSARFVYRTSRFVGMRLELFYTALRPMFQLRLCYVSLSGSKFYTPGFSTQHSGCSAIHVQQHAEQRGILNKDLRND